IAERPRILALSAILLFGPAIICAVWAVADTPHATGVVPAQYRTVSEHRKPPRNFKRAAEGGPAISSFIFTNNIRVTFLAFAGGIVFGAGTVLALLFNGALLGLVGGLAGVAGNGKFFVEFIVAHGVLELSCIVVAGTAGLRLGWALIAPGYRPRAE